MPSFSVLIEDTSPLLKYAPENNWTAGTSKDDNSADRYTESSFTKTQIAGSTMAFTFNGTGITVVGAKRGNHGSYSVNLDKLESPLMDGGASPDLFNQTLFQNGLLEQGSHSLLLTNHDTAFVDIDYITIQVSVGNDTEELIANTFQNTHPIFSYLPPSSWVTPGYVSSFSGGTGHATEDSTATAEISFQPVNLRPVSLRASKFEMWNLNCGLYNSIPGDGIAVYGPVGPNMTAEYIVQIDNGLRTSFSASKTFYRAQQILFFASNLGPGPHSLSMALGGGGDLAIDYATVFTTASLGGSFVETGGTPGISPNNQPTLSSLLPNGIIAALALTSTIAFAGICVFGYFLWRQVSATVNKKRWRDLNRGAVQPFHANYPNSFNPPRPLDISQYHTDLPAPVIFSNPPTIGSNSSSKTSRNNRISVLDISTTPNRTVTNITGNNFESSRIHITSAPPEYQEDIV